MKHPLSILSQIGGLILSAYMVHVGVDLLLGEIKAEGTVSIQTFFGSGTLTSGSAGLFMVFFAFFLALTSLLISPKEETNQTYPDNFQKAFRIFLILFFSFFFSLFIGLALEGNPQKVFYAVSGFLGTILFFWMFVITCAISDDRHERSLVRSDKTYIATRGTKNKDPEPSESGNDEATPHRATS